MEKQVIEPSNMKIYFNNKELPNDLKVKSFDVSKKLRFRMPLELEINIM